MDSVGSWNSVDPPDARFIALTTKIDALEKQLSVNNQNYGNGNGGNNDIQYTIEEWRLVKDSETKKVDGKMWWWCPRHNDGKGMYVRRSCHCPLQKVDYRPLRELKYWRR